MLFPLICYILLQSANLWQPARSSILLLPVSYPPICYIFLQPTSSTMSSCNLYLCYFILQSAISSAIKNFQKVLSFLRYVLSSNLLYPLATYILCYILLLPISSATSSCNLLYLLVTYTLCY
ncbi:hypothetical protein O6H91_03G057600 [Diphasiastrum complanatum]|uniref:Uncharacterized protein n=1 Tax=Diphasiastrum complanatum TaxID=34168 RepID=A0ACC2E6R8_DIPCM|nr:hypothetical protein O6H91_03G057600 [Diphasiastrum complanatum]